MHSTADLLPWLLTRICQSKRHEIKKPSAETQIEQIGSIIKQNLKTINVNNRPEHIGCIKTCSGSTWTTFFYITSFWYWGNVVPMFGWCCLFNLFLFFSSFWNHRPLCMDPNNVLSNLFRRPLVGHKILSWGTVFLCSVPLYVSALESKYLRAFWIC